MWGFCSWLRAVVSGSVSFVGGRLGRRCLGFPPLFRRRFIAQMALDSRGQSGGSSCPTERQTFSLPVAHLLVAAAGGEPASELPPRLEFVSEKQNCRWSTGSGR